MRFEKSIEIDAPQQRVWDVLSAIEDWPQRIETVDAVELVTPAPITNGSRVRLKQPKLPKGTWDITVWDTPSYFEWTQKTGGTTSVAGHRVGSSDADARHAWLAHPDHGPVLQGSDQPLHEPRSRRHEAGSRIGLSTATRRRRQTRHSAQGGATTRTALSALRDHVGDPVGQPDRGLVVDRVPATLNGSPRN